MNLSRFLMGLEIGVVSIGISGCTFFGFAVGNIVDTDKATTTEEIVRDMRGLDSGDSVTVRCNDGAVYKGEYQTLTSIGTSEYQDEYARWRALTSGSPIAPAFGDTIELRFTPPIHGKAAGRFVGFTERSVVLDRSEAFLRSETQMETSSSEIPLNSVDAIFDRYGNQMPVALIQHEIEQGHIPRSTSLAVLVGVDTCWISLQHVSQVTKVVTDTPIEGKLFFGVVGLLTDVAVGWIVVTQSMDNMLQ